MIKKTNKKNNTEKPVTKCDQSKEVVAKCNQPEEVIANCDHLKSLKFYPSLPYAFTEQGIGQLSTVVHSKIAIERSIMLGASVKDMGAGMCAVTKMEVSPELILGLLK